MYDLYIDTHSKYLNLTILKAKKNIKSLCISCQNSHSKLTVFKIKELMENLNISPNDIQKIIVVNGPGSFTGIRIGITIAKTFGFCKNLKVYQIDYLLLQAFSINDDSKIITSVKDNKGYYIGKFSKTRKKIGEYKYIKNENIEEVKKSNIFYEEKENVDIEKVYDKIMKVRIVNIHNIKPIYIKKINV